MAHHQVSPPAREKKRSLLLPILAIAAILIAMTGITAFMMKDRIAGLFESEPEQSDRGNVAPVREPGPPFGVPDGGGGGNKPDAPGDSGPDPTGPEKPEGDNPSDTMTEQAGPTNPTQPGSTPSGLGNTPLEPVKPPTEVQPPTVDPRPDRNYKRDYPNIALLVAGDPTLAEPMAGILETNLGLDKFRVMSRQDLLDFATDDDPGPIGETLYRDGVDVMVHIRLIPTGERSVRAGRRSAEVYASRVNLRVIQLRDRKMLNRRWSKPVEYTPLNAEGRAEDLAREIGNVIYDLFKK
jgi:hypothetical protein